MNEYDYLGLDTRALGERFRAGYPIEADALDGWAYRGTSLGLPKLVERLTWKTFQKAFRRQERDGSLRGWNVRLVQRGIDGPSEPLRRKDGTPITFGHFVVREAAGHGLPPGFDHGLLLDYRTGGNSLLHPVSWLVDPLVAVAPGDPTFLLGCTWIAVGAFRVPTPSYFTLRRDHRLP